MTINCFHPSDLNDVHSLREKFFSGQKELAALNSLPPSAYKIPKGRKVHGTFEVIWVLSTLPFRIIYSIFLRSISSLLQCAYLEKTATAISFEAQSVEIYTDSIIRQLFWGARRVVASSNTYAPNARYITQFDAIQRENLNAPLIRQHLTKLYDKVQFNLGEGGLCSGSVNWFNYLFLLGINQKTRLEESCNTFLEYMTAISQFFKEGQPIQAALLQTLYGVDCPLLSIKETLFFMKNERLKSRKDLVESLNILPKGLCHVRIKGIHSISLLKADGEILAFDPNLGLLNLETADLLADLILNYATDIGDAPIYFAYQELDRPNLFTCVKRTIWSKVFG